MFDSQTQDVGQRPVTAVSLGHLARESRLGLEAPRSYLVPVLFWITNGQGRIAVDGAVRGYTAHNAIFLPPNTSHALDVSARAQGSVVFFGGRDGLPRPSQPLHLRIAQMQKQTELNQLIECLRRDSEDSTPLADELLFHRAALTLLWICRESMDITPGVVASPRRQGLPGS